MRKLRLIPIGLIACLALAIGLLAPAAARQPTKPLLPRMVVPDASLVRLGEELRRRSAFFSTAADAAASSPDPNDTAADARRRGWLAGYVRDRHAVGAFSLRAPKGLLSVGTSVILRRDARSTTAAIRREIADLRRLSGKAVEGGRLVSFTTTRVPSLGSEAALSHIHVRPTGGTDRFETNVMFRVGSLRGNAWVTRSDKRNVDATALQLARQLRGRILVTLGAK